LVYFHWINGNIIITAKLNRKSDEFKCQFSYIYDIATHSLSKNPFCVLEDELFSAEDELFQEEN